MLYRLKALAAVLVLLTGGCTADASATAPSVTSPDENGTLSVSVVGIVDAVPTTATLGVTRTDIANQGTKFFALPPSGSRTLTLTVGVYRISFWPPSGYIGDVPASLPVLIQRAAAPGAISFVMHQILGSLVVK